jgi:hypothetical protein
VQTGDTANINYDDIYLYGIGLSRKFAHSEVYTLLEGRRAVVPGADNPLALIPEPSPRDFKP